MEPEHGAGDPTPQVDAEGSLALVAVNLPALPGAEVVVEVQHVVIEVGTPGLRGLSHGTTTAGELRIFPEPAQALAREGENSVLVLGHPVYRTADDHDPDRIILQGGLCRAAHNDRKLLSFPFLRAVRHTRDLVLDKVVYVVMDDLCRSPDVVYRSVDEDY